MAFIAWIISIAAFLGGLVVHQQPWLAPEPMLFERGLYGMALLACPILWAKETGWLRWTGIGRSMRVSACLAALLAIPTLYIH